MKLALDALPPVARDNPQLFRQFQGEPLGFRALPNAALRPPAVAGPGRWGPRFAGLILL